MEFKIYCTVRGLVEMSDRDEFKTSIAQFRRYELGSIFSGTCSAAAEADF